MRCPTCLTEYEPVDYEVVWPWPGSCLCSRLREVYIWLRIAGNAVEETRNFSSGEELTLRAEAIRRQPSGIHARVFALLGPSPNGSDPLTWDTFNVERQTDRTHFTNKAWDKIKGMPFVKDAMSQRQWAYQVDVFCSSLWQTWAGQYRAQLEGDEDVQALSFLLEPYVIEGCGTIIFAPPGAGKSYLTMAMAVAIDAGRSASGRCADRAPSS